jgi:hypothetical protein
MSRYACHPDAAAQPTATQAQPDIDVEDLDVGDDSALLKKRLRPASPRRSEVAEGDRELAVSVGKLKGPTRTKLKEVSRTGIEPARRGAAHFEG